VEEKELSTTIEACDCQGECGYGPNLLVDGKLVNNVRGREAVLQALGYKDDE
jgi:NADH:ubiquinone oxidoreductase subunit E